MAFTQFDELNGSPVIDVFVDRQMARRFGKVPWTSIDALITHLFPTDGSPPASFSSLYPALRAVAMHAEPFAGDKHITTSSGLDIATVNSYDSAHVAIEYAVDHRYHETSTTGADPVLFLTHSWSAGGEFLTIPSDGFKWVDDDALPDDISLGKIIPSIEHQISWPRIEKPPFGSIRSRIGKVNSTTMDFRTGTILPETLLFLGAELRRDILSNGTLGWEVNYNFSERRVKSDDGIGVEGDTTVGGWNHFFRSEDETSEGADDGIVGFYRIVGKKSGDPNVYDLADFADLFVEDP